MPWNLVCDPWVSWSFYKTTIIRLLTKWNESKIEKYCQKPLGFCRKHVIVGVCVCVCVCVCGYVCGCVYMWVCVCVCVGYSCVLLCVYVWVVYSIWRYMCSTLFLPDVSHLCISILLLYFWERILYLFLYV